MHKGYSTRFRLYGNEPYAGSSYYQESMPAFEIILKNDNLMKSLKAGIPFYVL